VEAAKVQVYLLVSYSLRVHTDNSVSFRRLLGLWWRAPQPCQCLFSPPQEWIPWCRRYPHAYPPGLFNSGCVDRTTWLPLKESIFVLFNGIWLRVWFCWMAQFITFGFACTPLYFVWEKVIGMHDTRSICLRALARLPVVVPIWFLAIIFPFFGPINSAVGALLVSFTVYIIPSLAHMLTYRKASARQVKMLLLVVF